MAMSICISLSIKGEATDSIDRRSMSTDGEMSICISLSIKGESQ